LGENFLDPTMSDPTVPRLPRLRPALLSLLLPLIVSTSACAGAGGASKRPGQELVAAGWIDTEPLGAATVDDPERLELLAQAGLRGRVLRLDRLLDLYDAARFAGDKEARESLWLALGGHSSTRGIDASREVVLRLLDEAYAIEDLAVGGDGGEPGALSEVEQRFVADAIMLLSTDMFLPDSAESLITATLAYRVLTEEGHPRIADNAHWRLYDYVRGVLEGAVEIGPQLRAEVVIHALYAKREDISAWLEDLGPHARPPLPSPQQLWALLEEQREALAQIERWQGVLASRAAREAELRETIMALLPRPRDPGWVLPELPQGTGEPESLAPVVLLEPGVLRLEPSSEAPREHDPRALDEAAVAAIEGLLARDGRGTILFASAPDVPAPEYAAALRALVEARAATIELAVHEPGLGEGSSKAEDEPPAKVVVALPLYVARPDDTGAGARALRDSRIHVQLGGRGPRFRVDGRWLTDSPTLPSDLRAFVERLRRAYPRQHSVSLSLAEDVQHRQVIDLLAALAGGRSPAFVAVGWMPDVATERAPEADPTADRALEARLQLGPESVELVRSAPEGLPAPEWARIEQATDSLLACVPELEAPLPKHGVTLSLELEDRKLVELEARGRKIGREGLEAFEACARERLVGFRLREHGEAVKVEVIVRAAGTK
jgi:hypothetical protein